ncbi:EAL domain-containing protein [Terripilifer ovatus]|uniref:bifunctional diguanylate cyclase/phosphodiesterase n=1 Tax=Terripilifer ovatus TaxID=3032367 RepID=UPI003AB93725
MVAKGETLKATADRLCAEVEKRFPDIVCSILTIDRSGLLHPLAAPSLPEAYSAALDGLLIGPFVGSCGTSAYLRMPVTVFDIENDPRWAMYKSTPLSLGLLACWSSPICDGRGEVVGVFGFYFREKRGPNAREKEIVDTCVHLCAIAIERNERLLQHERRANVDTLTGLSNRASFAAALSHLSCLEPGSWALLVVDLDNLKIINDTFGHLAGDDFLRVVASRISTVVLPDPVFRVGGDEFAILVQSPGSLSRIADMAAEILRALAEPAICGGHTIVPKATVGGAILSELETSTTQVREHADLALYHAKEFGRGGFVLYERGLSSKIMSRRKAIRDVTTALREDRVDAFYQPIFMFDTRKIVGMEALCRLRTPDGRIVAASEFYEATSDAQVATDLTQRMMSIVASDVRNWLDMGIPFQHVGINVASADVHGGKLNERLTAAFHRENVPLQHVILEITETVYMGERDQIVAREIKDMRTEGLRIALDDFGTGYASLTHLLTVPVDIIKIDKSFVDRLAPEDAGAAIVEGLVLIAGKLGIRVVAEGVETEAQLKQLSRLGCNIGQGYLFSRAVDRDAATKLLLESAEQPADILNRAVGEQASKARPARDGAFRSDAA